MSAYIVLWRILVLSALVAGVRLAPGTRFAAAQTPAPPPDASCLVLTTYPVGAGEHPHDVAPAADGKRIWYTAQNAGSLGLLDPATGETELVPLGSGSAPHGVIVGPDGAAWVTDGGLNAIIRVDEETHEIKTYPLDVTNANLNTAVFDRDGVLWFTGQSGVIGRLDHKTGDIVTTTETGGRGPYGITATPEGEVYFASLAGSYVGTATLANGTIQVEAIYPPTAGAGPRRVWSDSTGAVWISEWNAGMVGRYEPASGDWQEWKLPGAAPQAYAVYVDEHDLVWLSDFGGNALHRFNPKSASFETFPLPDTGGSVRQIHGRPGEIWGAESAADKLLSVTTNCPP
jgi:virginiamycin B lyase